MPEVVFMQQSCGLKSVKSMGAGRLFLLLPSACLSLLQTHTVTKWADLSAQLSDFLCMGPMEPPPGQDAEHLPPQRDLRVPSQPEPQRSPLS